MDVPKMVSKEEMVEEVRKLQEYISERIATGRLTDGVAMVAVAQALLDQDWMPREFVKHRATIISEAAAKLQSISQEVVTEARKRS